MTRLPPAPLRQKPKKARTAHGRKAVKKFNVQIEVVVTDNQGGQLKRVTLR